MSVVAKALSKAPAWARPQEALARLHWQAHILVLPSIVTASGKEENKSVALIVAQAFGLPVITLPRRHR